MTTETKTNASETLINATHAEAMNASRILYKEIQELKEMIAALMLQPASQPAATAPAATMTEGISFKAEKLIATVDKGKVYWKVTGANYQQFGVSVWPEVLEEAGFEPEEMNPLKALDLRGFTAICTVKDNGKPKKVTQLVKA
jgi:hypothetical protein